MISVQPKWCIELKLQQQSVLLLAARGPDGIEKYHPAKNIQRAYRATVLVAGRIRGEKRELNFGESGDSFMSLDRFAEFDLWAEDVANFINHIDSLPIHYVMHIMHGAEIIGYKHPNINFRKAWKYFYLELAKNFHLNPETETEMDTRLNDNE